MSNIDAVLQAATPTVMVPRFMPFEPMTKSGHRFLAAHDGLWLEIKRPWLHAVLPVALQQQVAMPYGWVKRNVTIQCGQIPTRITDSFTRDAAITPDIEIAGGGIWNEATLSWRYERFEATEADANHIRYQRPILAENEHLILDMHSHGRSSAFFSSTDDKDDKGEVKMAMVFGHDSDTGEIEMRLRLCILGMYMPINLDDVIGWKKDEVLHG